MDLDQSSQHGTRLSNFSDDGYLQSRVDLEPVPPSIKEDFTRSQNSESSKFSTPERKTQGRNAESSLRWSPTQDKFVLPDNNVHSTEYETNVDDDNADEQLEQTVNEILSNVNPSIDKTLKLRASFIRSTLGRGSNMTNVCN